MGFYYSPFLGLGQRPDRRLTIGRQEIVLKRTTPKNMATAGRTSGLVIQALRYLGKDHVTDPVIALMDFSRLIEGNLSEFVPRSEQVLGQFTSPFAEPPASYQINLPIDPTGEYIDLDNDSEQDQGVQIFAVKASNNLVGDSYLEQVEQLFFYDSYIRDTVSGEVLEGTFLIYAPDDSQGFPGGAGSDGTWFSVDDPAVGLPAGYTLATLNPDGSASFSRSREVVMDTIEETKWASPDISDEGMVESFNSLIDILVERYSFTEARGIDWEQVRQTYLPRVEEAEAAGDMIAFGNALEDMALSIRDAHVALDAISVPGYITRTALYRALEAYPASFGAAVVELSKGRFVIYKVDPDSEAAAAGWQFGTEILSLDGVPIGERVDSMPLVSSAGTQEVVRLLQTRWVLAYPSGTDVAVEYRQPGEEGVRSATLTSGSTFLPGSLSSGLREEISFKQLDGGIGYFQSTDFINNIPYKLAVWERFLASAANAPGIIIDMRNNGGGSNELHHTMASFLFTPEEPATVDWIDWYEYDEGTGTLQPDVTYFGGEYPLYSPDPELTYTGPIVLLVNENTGSAGEYFPQLIQSLGRAVVVAEHASKGAGGNDDRVTMPGGILFQFTKGRTTFAGTDELNLEARGVQPDVRVPVTLETVQAKLEGRDPVLETALQVLNEQIKSLAFAQMTESTFQWALSLDSAGQEQTVEDPAAYTLDFDEDGTLVVKADCNQAGGTYSLAEDGSITLSVDTITLAVCPEGSLSEEFLGYFSSITSVVLDGDDLSIILDPASGVFGIQLKAAE